jgi:hypothetical protein
MKIILLIVGVLFSLAGIALLVFGIGEDGLRVFTFWAFDVVLGISLLVAALGFVFGLRNKNRELQIS